MIRHEAIYNTHGNVVSIIGDRCIDLDGNLVEINETLVHNETIRLQAELQKVKYKLDRIGEYPPLQDLADALYWQSKGDNSKMEAYVAACEAVKEKYPKPE